MRRKSGRVGSPTGWLGAAVLALSFIVTAFPARAAYEIYKKKGFEKVAEIVEKKKEEDGTFTIKAKKKSGDTETVEIRGVVEIKQTADKKGMKGSGIVAPTPTPWPVVNPKVHPGGGHTEPAPSGAGEPVEAPPAVGGSDQTRAGLAFILDNLSKVAMVIMGITVAVVAFFVLSKK